MTSGSTFPASFQVRIVLSLTPVPPTHARTVPGAPIGTGATTAPAHQDTRAAAAGWILTNAEQPGSAKMEDSASTRLVLSAADVRLVLPVSSVRPTMCHALLRSARMEAPAAQLEISPISVSACQVRECHLICHFASATYDHVACNSFFHDLFCAPRF